jgi:hypothetical protein
MKAYLGGKKNMENNVKMGVYTRNGEDISFNYHTNIGVADKVKFVNAVSIFLIGDNYYSVLRDIAFDYVIIKTFTDIDMTEIDDSTTFLKSIESFLAETNIVEIVKANIDEELIEELNKAVDDNIEYRTGIHRNPISEGIGQLLKTAEKKLSNIDTEGMMEMMKIISGMSSEFTMEKMLNAYANSDVFKKNRETDNTSEKIIPITK